MATWQDGYSDVSLSLNGIEPYVTQWSVRAETPTFEASNIVNKVYEVGSGLTRYSVRYTYMIDKDNIREGPAPKTTGPAIFTDGSRYYSGDLVATSEERSGNPQGGLTVSGEGTWTGTVALTAPPVV